MADRALSSAIGDAIIGLAEWAVPMMRPKVRELIEQAADAVRPDPPISLVSLDGREVLTGIVVLDRGQVIAFLGARYPATTSIPRSSHRTPYGVDDDSFWPRSSDPSSR